MLFIFDTAKIPNKVKNDEVNIIAISKIKKLNFIPTTAKIITKLAIKLKKLSEKTFERMYSCILKGVAVKKSIVFSDFSNNIIAPINKKPKNDGSEKIMKVKVFDTNSSGILFNIII
jgi:hypothetical protein